MEITWETPPEAALIRGNANKGGPYLEFALALRERPGQWARVPRDYNTKETAAAAAQNMRRGKVKGFDAGKYEIVRDENVLWARYLDEESRTDPQTAPRTTDASGPAHDPSLRPSEAGYTRRVREWAQEQGIAVGTKGRLPKEVFDKFHEATDEPRPGPALRSVQ